MAKGIKTGGRTKGTPNKATKDIKRAIDSAADHVELAKNLYRIALKSDSDAAQVAATKEIWDRRFGKASQVIAGDPENPITYQEIRRTLVRPGHSDR